MEIDLNFGDVYTAPNGYYRLHIEKARYCFPKNGSNVPQINLQADIVDSPVEAFEGRTIFATVSFSKKAKIFMTRYLEALTGEEWREDGMSIKVNPLDESDEEFDPEFEPGQFTNPLMDDVTIVALLEADEYEGRVNAKVRGWFPDDGSITLGEIGDDDEVPTFSEDTE